MSLNEQNINKCEKLRSKHLFILILCIFDLTKLCLEWIICLNYLYVWRLVLS